MQQINFEPKVETVKNQVETNFSWFPKQFYNE